MIPSQLSRRNFLYGLNASIGSVALNAMLARDLDAASGDKPKTKGPHFPEAKAKNCIFLMMEGGPSHIDTFDPKPRLKDLHLKEFQREGEMVSAMASPLFSKTTGAQIPVDGGNDRVL